MQSDVSIIKHLGAILYDSFLVLSLVFVANLILVPVLGEASGSTLFFTVTLPITYAYFSWSWIKGGQTLGMKAWKFHLQTLSGDKLSHKHALLRFFTAFLVLVIPGILYKILDPNNLSLQDKVSQTILLKN